MDDVARALRLYLGRPDSAWPRAHPEEVKRAYGTAILAGIEGLLQEIGSVRIDWGAHDLRSATRYAEAEMKQRHPELSAAAIADLGWAFSYWNK